MKYAGSAACWACCLSFALGMLCIVRTRILGVLLLIQGSGRNVVGTRDTNSVIAIGVGSSGPI